MVPVYDHGVIIGASRPPTGSPMGLPIFFFFFFPGSSAASRPIFRRPSRGDDMLDWADILQKHTYGQFPGTVKKWFSCSDFSLSYLSKITQKYIPGASTD